MLLIKARPTTPAKRWKCTQKVMHRYSRLLSIFSKFKTNHRKTLIGVKALRGVRRLKKTILVQSVVTRLNVLSYCALQYHYYTSPLREYISGKSLYNHIKLFMHTELTYPGFKIYPVNLLLNDELNFSPVNQTTALQLVPLNYQISQVFNISNTRITFARSSGAVAIRKKNLKKTKLIYVQLPSKKLILLPLYTLCVFSIMQNLYLHKLVAGKWSIANTPKKLIHVRGVAKNPVDHPNGGRTKAKQPELSPWGWIAKKNK